MPREICPTALNILLLSRADGSLEWRKRGAAWFKRERDKNCWNACNAGKYACNHLEANGYLSGTILGSKYMTHRVVWALKTGRWPERQIDHINGDKTDNRISNLRDVSPVENSRNKKMPVTNTSGHIGVFRSPTGWYSQIRNETGQKISLGYFDSFNAAVAARSSAEKEFGYHPNHGR